MSDFENRTYYRSRQHQEEAAARAAAGPAARRIHEELAARYGARAGAEHNESSLESNRMKGPSAVAL